MKDYTDFIDVTLSDFANNAESAEDLEKFKFERKSAMRNRELQLRERGLSDSKVIKDLIISENIDARHDFIKLQRKSIEARAEKRMLILKFLLAVAYFMVIGILFILDSFYNDDWEHSWIIIVGGILLFAIMLFLMPNKFHYKGRRKVPFAYALGISILLMATFVWLIVEVVYGMHYSGVIFAITGFLLFSADAVVPALTKEKYSVWHSIVSTPLAAGCLYITLGLFKIVHWQTGWLLIIAGLVVSITIFVRSFNKKYKVSETTDKVRKKPDTKEEH